MSQPRLGAPLAVTIVFTTSAAVLVLEILAGRLLAPYTGVTLLTYTGIIGTVLAAIAVGTALGGRLADRVDPSRLLGPTLIFGGILAWWSLPTLAWLGPMSGRGAASIVVLTGAAFFLPAAVLSAASPMVAKLRLADLGQTGSVVGGLSAAGTAGALVGTFATGFVLIEAMPTRPIVLSIGGALVVGGTVLWWRFAAGMPSPRSTALVLAVIVGALGMGATTPSVCQWETPYFCVTVEHDPARPSGRVLRLDTLRHSYVDLDDPTHLEFRYVRLFAQVADQTTAGRIDALHIGGGGFTFPRYLDATRAGGVNLVAEIDPELVRIAQDRLGLGQGDDVEVVVDDARRVVADQRDDRFDLVVGDAFGSLSVPWHLTTSEFVADIARVLRPDGTYVLNVIDGDDVRFARAQTATLMRHFDHVAVVVPPTDTVSVANHVLVASGAPLAELEIGPDDGRLLRVTEVEAFVDGERHLTDDFAPVDQLIAE